MCDDFNPIDNCPQDESPVLVCEGLNKSYKKGEPVLKNFSISVPRGKILGLLGPNGCGKSTFLKLVSGLLTADSGRIIVDGKERDEKSNALISYLPERTYFTPSMKVSGLIKTFSEFYEDFDSERARNMLHDLGISESSRLKSLSKGMKEKVQLVMVMARKAKLYLLDEPLGGVDPASREYILSTIITNYNPDASVIITTHLIADIEPVLDEFAFMSFGGDITRAGNAEAVREGTGKSLDELFREEYRCSVKR